ncbi:Txe/YoeB family addiction module toxin [Thalassotalea sp. ND16A]|uniref:Txe/YoeB family addiction module toxin n=1 Tax=Thalassotalea sp. ND16A TaxID=1535422 RepID=UPI00051D5C49|nr:Txe/YoeB family addiction module toxin [Thalassotalea sp. ND16A]KGJ98400.1 hypothetical protein ND16A_0709 [Thalassotalea sp. ND16A]
MSKIKKKLNNELKNEKQVVFSELGWEDYQYWRKNDNKKFERLNDLIEDALKCPYSGIGKPEKLSGDLKGFYSRRIDSTHRFVYTIKDGELCIVMARFHY